MRVALIIPTLDRSGAEKQLTLLATELPARGIEPHVFTLDRGGPYAEVLASAGVPVTIVGKRGKLDRTAVGRLREGLERFAPAVVHSWLFSAHAYAWAAGRDGGAKWVQALRCVDTWKAPWQTWVDQRLWPRVDAFVANGQAVADHYAAAGVPREKLSVIANGVEPPKTSTPDPNLFARHRLPADAKVVLTVGRLAPQKRLKDLLWSFQLLRQAEPRARLVVVGDGPQKAELKEFARAVECAADVRFLGHADPRPWLATADAFWIGSAFEGMSNALMEAMAAGLPCVASSIPPNRELIEHGRQGYLPDPGDAMAFAQYTTRLLGDDALRGEIGSAAAARMRDDFAVSTMVDAYAGLYRGLA